MSKIVKVKLNILARAMACALASTGISARAQSTEDAAMNTAAGSRNSVENYRASLSRAMNAKREAVGLVDGVSSESPGEVSDSNLADAMQHIAGVGVGRTDGEASRINVRGIDQDLNLVTINGRKMPTVTNNYYQAEPTRGFDFDNLSGEGVNRVDVYKTGRADISAGGLGATIDVKTLRPFDIDETRATATLKAATDTGLNNGNGDKYTPEASGLFSWANQGKTLGATFAGSYQQSDFTLQKGEESTTVNFPITNSLNQAGDASRVRQNVQATLQYRPINNLTTTFEFLNLNNSIDTSAAALYVHRNRNGILEPYFENEKWLNEATAETTSVGFNLGYEFNRDFSLAIDYHDSTATGRNTQYSAKGTVVSPNTSPTGVSGTSELGLQESSIQQMRLNGSYHLGDLGFLSQSAVTFGIESRNDANEFKKFSRYTPEDYAARIEEVLQLAASLTVSKYHDTSVEEEINGGFVQFSSAFNINGMLANFLVGVHEEKTDVTSSGGVRVHPSTISQAENGARSVFYGSEPYNNIQKASYSNTLPNCDFDLAITDTVKTRLSLSKTIGRTSYGSLNPDASFGPYQNTATAEGNPALKPLESKNFDVAVEWYYRESSYASLGYFRKNLSNLIGIGIESKEFYNLRDMTLAADYAQRVADARMSGVFWISSQPTDPVAHFNTLLPVNNRETKIDGLEFSLQHVFGDSGFGVSANYTKVNAQDTSEIVNKPREKEGTNTFANLVGFYEKNDWQARIAYNWRDKYIDGSYNSGARYVADFTEIDCSLGYNVNKNLSVSMEAINITGEDQRQYGGRDTLVEELSVFGARYHVGARYLF